MLDTQPTTVSPPSIATSRGPELPSYGDLATRANALRLSLDRRALACLSDSERRRLRKLASVAAMLHQCLQPMRAGVR